MKTPEEIKKGLIEAIEETSWVVEGGNAHDLIDACEMAHASMADALAYIQKLEAQVPRWISVEERLPEGEDPVLILVKETERYGLHKEKARSIIANISRTGSMRNGIRHGAMGAEK